MRVELISLKFITFLALLLVTYYVIGHFAPGRRWIVLLLGSLSFFTLVGGWLGLGLVVAVALVTWVGSLLLYHEKKAEEAACRNTEDEDKKELIAKTHLRKRRRDFVCTLMLCLATLVAFRILRDARPFPGALGHHGPLAALGLCFYVLQALSYLIDTYRLHILPQPNFARYLLFVSYFPQVACGPINRYDAFFDQLMKPRRPNGEQVERALLRIGYGALKILAISNILHNAMVAVFQTAAGPNIAGSLAIFGTVVYGIFAYAEFSGMADILEGISELFGIHMAPNYRRPFFATSLLDFWGRWNSTLGTWMHDYVYGPLLASRPLRPLGTALRNWLSERTTKTLVAVIPTTIVFVLVGLWYGTGAHFAIWGLYHGLIISISALVAPLFDKLNNLLKIRSASVGMHAFRIVRTYVVVCIGWFFACFGSLHNAWFALVNALTNPFSAPLETALNKAGATYASGLGFTIPTLLVCTLVLVSDIAHERNVDASATVLGWKLPARATLYAVLILLAAYAAALDTTMGGGDLLHVFS
jgi:D-alanyl-lipoteichoic acid acyltransferase DltB (MBOAT superfamily)